jgi:hypothetical protein
MVKAVSLKDFIKLARWPGNTARLLKVADYWKEVKHETH